MSGVLVYYHFLLIEWDIHMFTLYLIPIRYVEKLMFVFFNFQYYEMSYGLNVEMHKQVRIPVSSYVICNYNDTILRYLAQPK